MDATISSGVELPAEGIILALVLNVVVVVVDEGAITTSRPIC